MDNFSCTVNSAGRCAVAHLNGELDMSNVGRLTDRLKPLAMAGRDVVVNFSGLSFFGTAGLAALDELDRHATAAGGSIRLTEVPAAVWRVLSLTGTRDRFHVEPVMPTPAGRAGAWF
jgi:anti-anti-sigma factor